MIKDNFLCTVLLMLLINAIVLISILIYNREYRYSFDMRANKLAFETLEVE